MKKYVHDKHKTLLLRSEVTKEYPKLIEALNNNEEITDHNINQFDEETQILLKHGLKRILEVARNEWIRDPVYQIDETQETKCSLCGRPNKYIFHIHNSKNGDTMNVGSDCITYFAPGQQKSVFIRTAKRNARIIELNKIYPGIEETIQNWSKKISEYDIVIPNHLARSYSNIGGQLEKCFRQYSDGKMEQTEVKNKIKDLLTIGKNIEHRMDTYVNENIGKRFVATRKMEIYLKNKNDSATLEKIKESGYVTVETAGYIPEPEFMAFICNELSQSIKESAIRKIRPIPGEKLYVFSVSPYQYIELAVTHSKMMQSLGNFIFNCEVIPDVSRKLLNIAQPYNKKSYEDILEISIKLLQKSDLRIHIASYRFDEIVFHKRKSNQYILVSYKPFVERCLRLIYQDRPHKEIMRLVQELDSGSIITKEDVERKRRMWFGDWEKEETRRKYRNRR